MKPVRHICSLLLCALPFALPVLGGPDTLPEKGHTVTRSDIAMDHQGGVTLKLELHYFVAEGTSIPGEEALMETALAFLESYANTTDYFEIVNRNLNRHLREYYPGLERLEVRFELEPRPTVPFVVLSRSVFEADHFDEFYGFILADVETAHPLLQDTNIRVWFQYTPNLDASEIPNVLHVHRDALRWLNLTPDESDTRASLGRELAATIMLRYKNITRVWARIHASQHD